MDVNIEQRLEQLGIIVSDPPAAIGNFTADTVHNNVLYVAGTYGTVKNDQNVDVIPKAGKLGTELTVEDGYASARQMALNQLAMAKAVMGSLDKLISPIRLVGYVNAAPGFQDAPSVLNGASDLLIEIFGTDLGRHARMALYQHELARNAPIAGEIMFAVKT
jgi:enamine deaminase RidA (YjgF/YER057c/UK114 family)